MPPSRFAALSPWRNLTSKSLTAYSELSGLSAVAASDVVGRSIAASPSTLYVRTTTAASASLLALSTREDAAGKYGAGSDKQAETVALPASGAVSDLEYSAFGGGRLAVGTDDGGVTVLGDGPERHVLAQWKHPVAGAVLVRWHPHADGVLLTASPSSATIAVWDITDTSTPLATMTVAPGPKAGRAFVNDAVWSRDGTRVYAALADGTVKTLDPRAGDNADPLLATTPPPMGIPKPIRLAMTGSYLLASTLNTSRQRELRIYDVANVTSPLQVISLDTASHPLSLSATDVDRNLIFMGSRGDVTIRWIELDDARKFPQGAFPLPPRTTFTAATLLPPVALDVMGAEIDRLFVVGADAVTPVRIQIPQRQTIDYHPHLYPDTSGDVPALTAREWRDGGDRTVQRKSLDPARRAEWGAGSARAGGDGGSAASASAQPATAAEANATSTPASTATASAHTAPAQQTTVQEPHASPVPAAHAPAPATENHINNKAAPAAAQTHAAAPTPVVAAAAPTATSDSNTKPSSANAKSDKASPTTPAPTPSSTSPSSSTWSRTTLTGTTPLLSAFTSVPAFDNSVAPSAPSLLATPSHILYQLAGPGGRLAFHSITRQGRLPEAKDVSWIETGSRVLDYDWDRFDCGRVVTGGEDGVRLWRLPVNDGRLQAGGATPEAPADEYVQTVVSQPETSLPGARAQKVAFHPLARDVLLVAGNEGVAVVDIRGSGSGDALATLACPTAGEAQWSPDGTRIALAHGTDRTLVVWDPRTNAQASIVAHNDSPRPFKIAWTDAEHLVTVGHGAGSMREVKLFHVDGVEGSATSALKLTQVGRTSLDTSPAILFPIYDADTQILYLWSKGERGVNALQLSLNAPKPRFGPAPPLFKPLPAFQHGTPQIGLSFLPKRYVNVRDVEVAIAYRLARNNEIQRVSWKVERKRKEFFQDDVFPPTRDVESAVYSAVQGWFNASSPSPLSSLPHLDLRPHDMSPLSTAPPPAPTTSSLAKGPTERILTDKEREDEYMQGVFAKAKAGNAEEGDQLEETDARRRAPDDDDWGDD